MYTSKKPQAYRADLWTGFEAQPTGDGDFINRDSKLNITKIS